MATNYSGLLVGIVLGLCVSAQKHYDEACECHVKALSQKWSITCFAFSSGTVQKTPSLPSVPAIPSSILTGFLPTYCALG